MQLVQSVGVFLKERILCVIVQIGKAGVQETADSIALTEVRASNKARSCSSVLLLKKSHCAAMSLCTVFTSSSFRVEGRGAIKPKMMSRFEDAAEYEDAKVELAGRMIGDIMAAPEMTDAQAVFEGIRNYTN